MANYQTSREVGLTLCAALGIDPTGVTKISIECGIEGDAAVAVVKLDRLVGVEDHLSLIELLNYRLVPSNEASK